MNTLQSIIVYRNPAEAAFWESGMLFPMIVGTVVMFVVSFAAISILSALFPYAGRYRAGRFYQWVSSSAAGIGLSIGVAAGVAVIWNMI